MEKKLLLLGLLRDHAMHGYQLNEVLAEQMATGVVLSKANAYKLLKKMEADGWITFREEQEGNRPPRRVYEITEQGETTFQALLRESLVSYSTPGFPAAVALNFLDLLPNAEAVALLQQRKSGIVERLKEVQSVPDDMRAMHLGIEYVYRFYQFELTWLDEVIGQLRDA